MRAEFFRGEVQRFHSAEQIVDFHADSLEEASKEGAKSQAFNDQAAALQEALQKKILKKIFRTRFSILFFSRIFKNFVLGCAI